jgi:hypothetical protein
MRRYLHAVVRGTDFGVHAFLCCPSVVKMLTVLDLIWNQNRPQDLPNLLDMNISFICFKTISLVKSIGSNDSISNEQA